METLFYTGLISWVIHILATGAIFSSFNHIKSHLKDPANLPIWYKIIIWVENLSALGYWISTILIFFSFQSPAFMAATILAVIGIIVLMKLRKKNKVSPATEEEIENFKLGFKGILTIWRYTLEVFLIGASPYLIFFLFTLI